MIGLFDETFDTWCCPNCGQDHLYDEHIESHVDDYGNLYPTMENFQSVYSLDYMNAHSWDMVVWCQNCGFRYEYTDYDY